MQLVTLGIVSMAVLGAAAPLVVMNATHWFGDSPPFQPCAQYSPTSQGGSSHDGTRGAIQLLVHNLGRSQAATVCVVDASGAKYYESSFELPESADSAVVVELPAGRYAGVLEVYPARGGWAMADGRVNLHVCPEAKGHVSFKTWDDESESGIEAGRGRCGLVQAPAPAPTRAEASPAAEHAIQPTNASTSEKFEGEERITFAVAGPLCGPNCWGGHSLAREGGLVFPVSDGGQVVEVTATWTASTPASERLLVLLGKEVGEGVFDVVAGAAGASPLTLRFEDPDEARHGLIAFPEGEVVGVAFDQKVAYTVIVVY